MDGVVELGGLIGCCVIWLADNVELFIWRWIIKPAGTRLIFSEILGEFGEIF